MAAKEIKQRIVLEGEKEYNQAIRDAQRNLKTLKSELKAETAEMGRNATEQQKAEAKAKSLKAQIAEQEKVVKTLKAALAQAKEEYGDNADVVAKWEQKLNNARTTLANMQNDLESVGSGFRTVNTDAAAATVATKSVADSLGAIGGAGDAVAGAIESIFTGMIDTVTSAVGELWDLISETAARANNWTDLASYYGSTAKDIQLMDMAISSAAGDFGKFTNLVNQLSFGGKNKKITEWFGISDENYTNNIDYTLAVLDAMQRAYRDWGTGGKWDSAMADIFGGKKSADVSWFVTNLDKIRENMAELSKDDNYLLNEDELGTMNDLWLQINKIEEKWEAIKRKFASGFGQVSLDLLVNVEGTLDGIADYLNATDDEGKQAAIDKIRTNVEDFFTKLGEVIRDCIHIIKDVGLSLKESDDPLTSAIGDILVKLSEGLQWIVDNADKVKQALEFIFGAWLLLKLAAIAGKLSGIVKQIEVVKAFKGFSAAGAAGGAAEAAASGSTGGIMSGVGTVLAKVAPWLVGASILGKNAFTEQGNDDILDENGNLRPEMAAAGWTVNEKGEPVAPAEFDGRLRFANDRPEIEEDVDLTPVYTDQDRENAVQDWWDAWRESADDEGSALEWFQEVFGDKFGDVWDNIIRKLDELDEGEKMPEDIPADWWMSAGNWNQDRITGSDLNSFRGLPGQLKVAAQAGVAAGVSGLKVSMDGRLVGAVVAPYVSEMIARDLDE